MQPTRNNVLVERVHPEYKGLIELLTPADTAEIIVQGRVIAVGPKVKADVKPGDMVLFSTRGNTKVRDEIVLIGEMSLAATLEN